MRVEGWAVARESIDVLEFQRRFATEDACRQYLFRQRWPDGFICPRCGCREYSEIRSRHLYQCKSCRYQASLTAGTVFHKTHMPLQKWFWAVFLVAHDKGGCSAVRLSQQLNTRLETAWLMLHKIRAAMGQRESQYQLGGLVKLDDAFFGNREREGSSGRDGKSQRGSGRFGDRSRESRLRENEDGQVAYQHDDT